MKQSSSNDIRQNEKQDVVFPVQRAVETTVTPELEHLLQAAAQGDPDAEFQLAEYYYKSYEEGDGGEKALAEAVKWYQHSTAPRFRICARVALFVRDSDLKISVSELN